MRVAREYRCTQLCSVNSILIDRCNPCQSFVRSAVTNKICLAEWTLNEMLAKDSEENNLICTFLLLGFSL